MAQKKLLTNGNVFKRTDNRWGGVVWYSDEQVERRRKSFSGTTKQEVNRKITDYIAAFNESKIASQESKIRLRDSMQGWLELFKFPSVERTTYDRCECTARNQIYPLCFVLRKKLKNLSQKHSVSGVTANGYTVRRRV